jgi:glycosyltransferase involved in cell wall biosynthesis
MKLLYISNGNIPSQWAHTVQVMKMAEAFTRHARGFRLLIAGDWRSILRGGSELRRWYGLSGPVRLRRLRMGWTLPRDRLHAVNWPEFNAAAVRFAVRRRSKLVMTRSYRIALSCLEAGLDLLFETHAGPDHAYIDIIRAIAAQPTLRGVVTIAEPLRDAYLRLGVPADRILVWPDAVDLARYRDLESLRKPARRRLGLPGDARVVVYTGHLYEHKGVGTLLDAARLLPDIRFLIVGGWPDDVTRVREKHASLANVDFRGFVPNAEIPAHLAAADVCALPNSAADDSASWTSPLKLFEYMASRRPIVATGIPAVRSVLRDGENAVLVAPDDPPALAAAIRSILAAPHHAAQLAQRARQDVERFTWDRRAQAILDRFAPDLRRGRRTSTD